MSFSLGRTYRPAYQRAVIVRTHEFLETSAGDRTGPPTKLEVNFYAFSPRADQVTAKLPKLSARKTAAAA